MSRKQEVERKFLVDVGKLPPLPPGTRLAQGYLSTSPAVRVRTHMEPDGSRAAYLTIKGSGLVGREEFEYEIPFEEAEALLGLCVGARIEKTRARLPAGPTGLVWEIDRFEGENAGLVVAEIELEEEGQPFERPSWLGEDVTEDPRYKNAALSGHPFRLW